MRKKTPERQPKISTNSLLETSKKGDIELTEQELDEGALNKVVGGSASLFKATTAGTHFKQAKLEI